MQHQHLAYTGSVIKIQMDLTNTRGNNKYSNISTWLSSKESLGTDAELLPKFIQSSRATPHHCLILPPSIIIAVLLLDL